MTEEILSGLRREMTREMFEELCALQCRPEEILGYIGAEREELEGWCRRVYGEKASLEKVMRMARQDGLISIRRASFELLKKSAPLVSQQYARYLPGAGHETEEENPAVRLFTGMLDRADPELLEEVFE